MTEILLKEHRNTPPPN